MLKLIEGSFPNYKMPLLVDFAPKLPSAGYSPGCSFQSHTFGSAGHNEPHPLELCNKYGVWFGVTHSKTTLLILGMQHQIPNTVYPKLNKNLIDIVREISPIDKFESRHMSLLCKMIVSLIRSIKEVLMMWKCFVPLPLSDHLRKECQRMMRKLWNENTSIRKKAN